MNSFVLFMVHSKGVAYCLKANSYNHFRSTQLTENVNLQIPFQMPSASLNVFNGHRTARDTVTSLSIQHGTQKVEAALLMQTALR